MLGIDNNCHRRKEQNVYEWDHCIASQTYPTSVSGDKKSNQYILLYLWMGIITVCEMVAYAICKGFVVWWIIIVWYIIYNHIKRMLTSLFQIRGNNFACYYVWRNCNWRRDRRLSNCLPFSESKCQNITVGTGIIDYYHIVTHHLD